MFVKQNPNMHIFRIFTEGDKTCIFSNPTVKYRKRGKFRCSVPIVPWVLAKDLMKIF